MPRTDDIEISDVDLLLRRIHDKPLEWYLFVEDTQEWRVSSAAFRDAANEVSVNLAKETTSAEVLEGHSEKGLASIISGLPRALDHIVSKTLDPDDPEEPSHRVICPQEHLSGQKIRKAAKRMSLEASWILLPEAART